MNLKLFNQYTRWQAVGRAARVTTNHATAIIMSEHRYDIPNYAIVWLSLNREIMIKEELDLAGTPCPHAPISLPLP